MENSIKRYEFIDIAKGIGILLVILGHMVTLHGFASTVIYSFHMPMFFLISGLFANTKRSFSTLVKKNFKHLIISFYIVVLTGIVFALIIDGTQSINKNELISIFLYGNMRGIHANAIWFLPCLFFTIILFYIYNYFVLSRFDFIINAVLFGCLIVLAYYFPNGFRPNISFKYAIQT